MTDYHPVSSGHKLRFEVTEQTEELFTVGEEEPVETLSFGKELEVECVRCGVRRLIAGVEDEKIVPVKQYLIGCFLDVACWWMQEHHNPSQLLPK